MGAFSIRIVKPNVTPQDAVRFFAAPGLSSLYWNLRSGPLRRIADIYVPFWLYRVSYALPRAAPARFFALDAVDGSLDLFEFPHLPAENQMLVLETRNVLKPFLTEARAEQILREKVLRVIFQQGFFKLRTLNLEVSSKAHELYLPYWLGIYGRGGTVRCRVMDAVRRRIEGAKASTFFEQWLAA